MFLDPKKNFRPIGRKLRNLGFLHYSLYLLHLKVNAMTHFLKTFPWVQLVWERGAPTEKLMHDRSVYLNTSYIISIEPAKNDLNEGSKITTVGAMTNHYYDDRTPDEIYALINLK